MKTVLHSFLVILLASVCTAGIPNGPAVICGPNCGTTSCVADIMGKQLQTYNPALIAGLYNDIYGIFVAGYDYQTCHRLAAYLEVLSAYVFEIPASKTRSSALIALVIADENYKCPYVFQLRSDSPGCVPQLSLEWKTVYQVITSNNGYLHNAPCNLVGANAQSTNPATVKSGAIDIVLYLDEVTSFQAVQLNPQGSSFSLDKGDYQCVQQIPYNTFVERVFYQYYQVNKTCPIPNTGVGKTLSDQNYDYSNFFQPRGGCRLATEYQSLSAFNPQTSVGFSILLFVSPQSNTYWRMTVLVTSEVRSETFEPLDRVCAQDICQKTLTCGPRSVPIPV